MLVYRELVTIAPGGIAFDRSFACNDLLEAVGRRVDLKRELTGCDPDLVGLEFEHGTG